jgi:NTP pyrophosphatase (non-canonical NTP hydrolase)
MTSISDLQERCGVAAQAKGFHDDRPKPAWFHRLFKGFYDSALRDWQGNKLMLIVSEVAEAQDELRKGHAANHTYYPKRPLPGSLVAEVGMEKARELVDADPVGHLQKPEGCPSELADVVIRVLDFCYTEGIDLETIIEEKLAYNATRGYKHGKKF